ncbi:MAG TPA: histidine phosphatase family protein [Phototrophicaceae bacterium]|jgi:phosphohistidine phosphatase|nr:histidine phosphatase family protein [Phototrophicaceae bacterium]
MKLYFLRHAHAEDGKGISDHERKLTPGGIKAASSVSRLMVALQLKPTRVFSSPRVRASQTADIIAAPLGVTVEVREELNFDFNISAASNLTRKLSDDDSILFVGHEPSLSITIGEITGGRVEMKKSGLARVDTIGRLPLRGQLVWLLTPKVISSLDNR